jgi:hypothetical protein
VGISVGISIGVGVENSNGSVGVGAASPIAIAVAVPAIRAIGSLGRGEAISGGSRVGVACGIAEKFRVQAVRLTMKSRNRLRAVTKRLDI